MGIESVHPVAHCVDPVDASERDGRGLLVHEHVHRLGGVSLRFAVVRSRQRPFYEAIEWRAEREKARALYVRS